VTGFFKTKNSSNNLLLLVYALVLKFNLFLHPVGPLKQSQDHFLYKWLIDFLAPLHLPAIVYIFFAFVLIYTQATLFNRICNAQKVLIKPNYLPAMAYILITSLFPEWNLFSSPLLVNSFLIWVFYRLITLPGAAKPGSAIFNIGFIIGIISLLYQPALVFVLLTWIAIFMMRPFHIREWLINILGVTTPYYFLAIILYLSNSWDWNKLKPVFSFGLPAMPSSVFVTISIALLVLPFIIGGFFVQANLSKMFIQVRKSWSLLLLFVIISTIIILVDGSNNYVNWMLCVVPLTAFHAAAYFYPSNKLFAMVMHWIIFGYAMYVNYWL
jgi:hypothetical protein